MSDNFPVSEEVRILSEARKLIEVGWGKGRSFTYFNGRTHYCALAALNSVTTYGCNMRGLNFVVKALPWTFRLWPFRSWQDDFSSIIAYNDAAKTTRQDILALFDRAILFAMKTKVVV